jgi:hypothetical protein
VPFLNDHQFSKLVAMFMAIIFRIAGVHAELILRMGEIILNG